MMKILHDNDYDLYDSIRMAVRGTWVVLLQDGRTFGYIEIALDVAFM